MAAKKVPKNSYQELLAQFNKQRENFTKLSDNYKVLQNINESDQLRMKELVNEKADALSEAEMFRKDFNLIETELFKLRREAEGYMNELKGRRRAIPLIYDILTTMKDLSTPGANDPFAHLMEAALGLASQSLEFFEGDIQPNLDPMTWKWSMSIVEALMNRGDVVLTTEMTANIDEKGVKVTGGNEFRLAFAKKGEKPKWPQGGSNTVKVKKAEEGKWVCRETKAPSKEESVCNIQCEHIKET